MSFHMDVTKGSCETPQAGGDPERWVSRLGPEQRTRKKTDLQGYRGKRQKH